MSIPTSSSSVCVMPIPGLGGLTPLEFQAKVLADIQLPTQIVMRHATPRFSHIFSDDGYAAAYLPDPYVIDNLSLSQPCCSRYWSYLWADALVSDAVEAFKESPGGMYCHPLIIECVVVIGYVKHSFCAGTTLTQPCG